MPNGAALPHVDKVHLKADSAVLVVQVVGFTTGNWAEISGYVIQNGNAIPFSVIQQVPAPDPTSKASSLTVTLPPMDGLTPEQDVTVITRVTEAQIWPTVLGYNNVPDRGYSATWQAKSDNPTGGQGGVQPKDWSPKQTAGPEVPAGVAVTADQPADPANGSSLGFTMTGMQNGTRYHITVEAVGPK